jgi:predicted aspartyl protease
MLFRYPYRTVNLNSPTAPLALLNIAAIGSDDWVTDIPALLDSGADVTVLPEPVVTRLGLIPVEHLPATGFDGHTSLLPIFTIQLVVRDFPSIEVEVMGGIAERYAVLGRDVLNRFKVVLDGPNGRVEISG